MSDDDIAVIKPIVKMVRAWKPSDAEMAIRNLGNGIFVDFGSHSEYKKAEKVRIKTEAFVLNILYRPLPDPELIDSIHLNHLGR
jgi:hypothetical protein